MSSFQGYTVEQQAQQCITQPSQCPPFNCKPGDQSCFCVYSCGDMALYGDCSQGTDKLQCPPGDNPTPYVIPPSLLPRH